MHICFKCNCLKSNTSFDLYSDLCYKCGHKVIDIDENISEIILLLNERGYETLFSCEGHLYPDSIHEGYIAIHDIDGTCEEVFSFLCNEYEGYQLGYESTDGPRNIINREIIKKFVLRFPFIESNTCSIFVYREKKVKFYHWLYNQLKNNLPERLGEK